MFVAEAKFRKQTAEYTELIRRQDGAAILELLTDRAVELKVGACLLARDAGWLAGCWLGGSGRLEEAPAPTRVPPATGAQSLLPSRARQPPRPQVVERVRLKAATFGQEDLGSGGGASPASTYKVQPEVVAQLYEEWVMPLTKEVEVQYLLRRLDGEPGGSGAPGAR